VKARGGDQAEKKKKKRGRKKNQKGGAETPQWRGKIQMLSFDRGKFEKRSRTEVKKGKAECGGFTTTPTEWKTEDQSGGSQFKAWVIPETGKEGGEKKNGPQTN